MKRKASPRTKAKRTTPKTRRTSRQDPFEVSLQAVIRDAGITKRGEPLARIVWLLAPAMFDAASPDSNPFEVADTIIRLVRNWAAEVDITKRKAGTTTTISYPWSSEGKRLANTCKRHHIRRCKGG